MELRPLYKGSKREMEASTRNRRQEEKKDEGIVNLNKTKAESVSSWCYPRQAGSKKAHQPVIWSLIFIVFGVHLVKAEVQENLALKGDRKRGPSRSPGRHSMDEEGDDDDVGEVLP